MIINIPSGIIKGTISVKKNKDFKYEKIKIQKLDDPSCLIQISMFTKTQVFHKNFDEESAKDFLVSCLENDFNNLELFTKDYVYSYRITSKGKLLSNR